MNHTWTTGAAFATGALGAWAVVLSIIYLWASLPSRAGSSAKTAVPLSTVLVRPCCGHEARLADCLASSGREGATFLMRTCFAVASDADGAYPTAQSVAAALSARGFETKVVLTAARGPNRKADQLARALSEVAPEASVVIVADSDVDLEHTPLEALVAPLFAGKAAAVWVPPVEVAPVTLADHASAAVLDTSLHAFRLLARLDESGMVGKLFAIRTDALVTIGGFGALTVFLGEDIELSRRLRGLGLRVMAAPFMAKSLACGRSWREVVARYARWIGVVRSQRAPLLAAYPLLFFALPMLLPASVLASVTLGTKALLPGVVALSARLALGVVARYRSGRPIQLATLVPAVIVAECLLAVAFVQALTFRHVTWRGARLALSRDGRMRISG